MSYAEHELQSEVRLLRRRFAAAQSRRRTWLVWAIAIVILLAGSVLLITGGALDSDEAPQRPDNELTVSLGFSRQPVVRNYSVDIDVDEPTADVAEADPGNRSASQ